jgi:hypothetical protein
MPLSPLAIEVDAGVGHPGLSLPTGTRVWAAVADSFPYVSPHTSISFPTPQRNARLGSQANAQQAGLRWVYHPRNEQNHTRTTGRDVYFEENRVLQAGVLRCSR